MASKAAKAKSSAKRASKSDKPKASKADKPKATKPKAAAPKAATPPVDKGKPAAPVAATTTTTTTTTTTAAAPAAPGATPAGPGASAVSPFGVKKKNVKRGAPPMLPRRMVRRDPPPPLAPGATPAPPRLIAQPGSLHAPARAPEGAESLKQRLGTVMGLINQLRGLKRTLNRQFFEAGLILLKLSEPTLFQAKGYGSFDRFVEREIEKELAIGRSTANELLQIVKLFQRDAAEQLGLERLRAALKVLFPEPGPQTASQTPGSSG